MIFLNIKFYLPTKLIRDTFRALSQCYTDRQWQTIAANVQDAAKNIAITRNSNLGAPYMFLETWYGQNNFYLWLDATNFLAKSRLSFLLESLPTRNLGAKIKIAQYVDFNAVIEKLIFFAPWLVAPDADSWGHLTRRHTLADEDPFDYFWRCIYQLCLSLHFAHNLSL